MRPLFLSLSLLGLGGAAMAQIGLPQPGQVIGPVIGSVDRTVDRTLESARDLDLAAPVRSVTQLARERVRRLQALVRANPGRIELDDQGQPARRGVILLIEADGPALETARRLGFEARGAEGLDALGLAPAELIAPRGMRLSRALGQLRKALPGRTLTADVLYFESAAPARAAGGGPGAAAVPIDTPVGLIDSGVAPAVAMTERRGFATGAPSASDHGTAIAALMRGAGVRSIYAADVYGSDPAGGGALAIARALDWLVGRRVRVVSISLVGPRNPLLERAIAATIARGATVIAAVGNDGPSAPAAYPASYPSVLAVTAVDRRNRALIEAGRALHLDYAAPGADISAPDAQGERKAVRGTSFAAPLVAARAAAAIDSDRPVRQTLDSEARDLGPRGPDKQFGRGLLCETCVSR